MPRRQAQPGDCETPEDREFVRNLTHAYLNKVTEPNTEALYRILSDEEEDQTTQHFAQERVRRDVIQAAKKRDVPEMLRVAGDDPALLKLALVESHKKHRHGRERGERRRGDDPFRGVKELSAQEFDLARKFWKDTFGKTYSGRRNAEFLKDIIEERINFNTPFTLNEIEAYLKDRNRGPRRRNRNSA
jgi:hypothetical protein